MVADDDLLIGRILERLLDACEVVYEPDTSAAARRILSGEHFDLVLCDLHMPGGGAPELLLATRTAAPAVARRVVVMTGGSVTGQEERFLRSCGLRILPKPFEKEELEAVVRWASADLPS